MNQASEGHFTFHFANRSFQLNTENIEFAEMYAEKLEPCLKQVQSFIALTPHVKIDDNIYQALAQGLINRFDDLVNSVGKIDTKQFSLILNDVTVNFQKAALIGLSRLQTDWEIVCKIAFKDNKIPQNSCRLSGITLMNADPHNNGQVPWRCEISNEQNNEKSSIFYKPSPIVIDMLLHGNTALLHELNISPVICGKYHVASIPPSFAELTHNATHAANLSSYIIVPMKDRDLTNPTNLFNQYGYMEFLVADDKSQLNEYNLEHHRLYSFQAGKVAAAALACGMQDLHFENLLICRKQNEKGEQMNGQIYVIDSENSAMTAIPDPNLTQLFRTGLGGFYGDYKDKPNRFFYRSNNQKAMYYIRDIEFLEGARQLYQTLEQKADAIKQWLEHPLFLQAPLRVIPLPTLAFYELRHDVMEQRMQGRSRDQIILPDLDRYTLPEEVSHLEHSPNDTYSDTELQSVIFMGNNQKFIIDSLYQGDIPTYHILTRNRSLLALDGKPVILPRGTEPINFFLHVPGQAFHNRIQLLQNFPAYRDASVICLQYHLLAINTFLTRYTQSQELEDKSIASQQTAALLYRLLDYTCVLSYLSLANSRDKPDDTLVAVVLGLQNLMASITREAAEQNSSEIRMTTIDTSVLINRAEELLKLLEDRYRQGVVKVGQEYTLHGKIIQTYNALKIMHQQIMQPAHVLQTVEPLQTAPQPPSSLTTPVPSSTGSAPKASLRAADSSKGNATDNRELPPAGRMQKP